MPLTDHFRKVQGTINNTWLPVSIRVVHGNQCIISYRRFSCFYIPSRAGLEDKKIKMYTLAKFTSIRLKRVFSRACA